MENRKLSERVDTPLFVTAPTSHEEIALEIADASRAVASQQSSSIQLPTATRKRVADFDIPSSANTIRDTTVDQRAGLDASNELAWSMWKQFDEFNLEKTSNVSILYSWGE